MIRHRAVAFALEALRNTPQAWTVADLAGRVGLCQRRFIRLFAEEVGLTPKLYGRIVRFQEVLRVIDSGKRVSWARLAAASGYYDQAHFINDFRAFSGMNPTAYLGLRTEHINHVPLVD